jgi:hypothetical protein
MSDSDQNSIEVEELELKQQKSKRGVYKRKLTLFKKFIEKINVGSLTAEIIVDINLRLDQLPKLYEDFSKVQDRIETLCSEEGDIEAQAAERESFEDIFYRLTAKAKVLVKNVEAPVTIDSRPPQSVGESIKYPEISLPSYDGDLSQWLQFRDTFHALVNQGSLPPIVKYKYLRSCLQGSALEVISSLDFSEEGYTLAWQMLCERYNNPRRLVSNHMRALFDVETVPSTPLGLRGLCDNISKHLRSLHSLNVPIDNWDLMIIHILANKLDSRLKSKWENSIDSRKLPSLQEFRAFLRNRADRLEASSPAAHSDDSTIPKKAMVTTSEPTKVTPNHKKTNSCPYCSGTHYINQCQKFSALSVGARIRVINKLRLCFNCLSGTHIIANCRASTCRLCRGKHHTLLHKPNTNTYSNTSPNNNNPRLPSTMFTNEQPSSSHNQIESTTLMCNKQTKPISQNKSVILPTAQVLVRDKYNKVHRLKVL